MHFYRGQGAQPVPAPRVRVSIATRGRARPQAAPDRIQHHTCNNLLQMSTLNLIVRKPSKVSRLWASCNNSGLDFLKTSRCHENQKGGKMLRIKRG